MDPTPEQIHQLISHYAGAEIDVLGCLMALEKADRCMTANNTISPDEMDEVGQDFAYRLGDLLEKYFSTLESTASFMQLFLAVMNSFYKQLFPDKDILDVYLERQAELIRVAVYPEQYGTDSVEET